MMMMQRMVLTLCSLVWLGAAAPPNALSETKFAPHWRALAGQWRSEAATGLGTGTCAFRFELGDHIIVRTNHAEVLPAGNRTGGIHDDLMVIHPGASQTQARATYWDNEGHVIDYTATWSADGHLLTFLSSPGAGPRFRLTYKIQGADGVDVSFDIAPPGQDGAFKTYTSGRMRRQK
jgi:hypothetical protein